MSESISGVVAFLHILIGPSLQSGSSAHGSWSCTSVPSLYANWKALTPWPNESDSAIKDHLKPYRSTVSFDPFDAVINGDSATRATRHERVLWEDDSVIVIVAKRSSPHDVLVIPKREMMFPVDASADLLSRLATVAVAVSGAFIESGGKQCDNSVTSTIEIRSPSGIGVNTCMFMSDRL